MMLGIAGRTVNPRHAGAAYWRGQRRLWSGCVLAIRAVAHAADLAL